MPKIALCIFATGRYQEFLDQLRDSARRFFLPDDHPDLVAFTDLSERPEGYDRHFQVPHLKWPYGTLYRYRWLVGQHDTLRNYEYLYMADVDLRFVSTIGDEILGRLVAVQHAGHLTKRQSQLPYIRNRDSVACVKSNAGQAYYAGGFQGGVARKYLRACQKIDEWIQYDERRGFIPDWHDEQYWNSYLVQHPPQVPLGPDYCWGEPDGIQPTTKILALVKPHAAFRSDGADPADPKPQIPAAPTAVPTADQPTEQDEPNPEPLTGPLDYQKAIYFLRGSNVPVAIRNRLIATLEQVDQESPAPTAPDQESDLLTIAKALETSKPPASACARAASTLRQMAHVMERAAPRVYCRGAQHGLGSVLRKLLPDDPVVYVDVGASEPIDCSNTWQFYETGGHGLLIEPRPSCWYPLLLQRPRDLLWPTAVAATTGWTELIECGGCTSLAPNWVTDVRGRLMVQTLPLRDIMAHFPDIQRACHLLSIDIEGLEEQALATWDWSAARPDVVVVEYHVFPRPDEDDMRANVIAEMLAEHDYEMVHRDALNVVFTREDS